MPKEAAMKRVLDAHMKYLGEPSGPREGSGTVLAGSGVYKVAHDELKRLGKRLTGSHNSVKKEMHAYVDHGIVYLVKPKAGHRSKSGSGSGKASYADLEVHPIAVTAAAPKIKWPPRKRKLSKQDRMHLRLQAGRPLTEDDFGRMEEFMKLHWHAYYDQDAQSGGNVFDDIGHALSSAGKSVKHGFEDAGKWVSKRYKELGEEGKRERKRVESAAKAVGKELSDFVAGKTAFKPNQLLMGISGAAMLASMAIPVVGPLLSASTAAAISTGSLGLSRVAAATGRGMSGSGPVKRWVNWLREHKELIPMTAMLGLALGAAGAMKFHGGAHESQVMTGGAGLAWWLTKKGIKGLSAVIKKAVKAAKREKRHPKQAGEGVLDDIGKAVSKAKRDVVKTVTGKGPGKKVPHGPGIVCVKSPCPSDRPQKGSGRELSDMRPKGFLPGKDDHRGPGMSGSGKGGDPSKILHMGDIPLHEAIYPSEEAHKACKAKQKQGLRIACPKPRKIVAMPAQKGQGLKSVKEKLKKVVPALKKHPDKLALAAGAILAVLAAGLLPGVTNELLYKAAEQAAMGDGSGLIAAIARAAGDVSGSGLKLAGQGQKGGWDATQLKILKMLGSHGETLPPEIALAIAGAVGLWLAHGKIKKVTKAVVSKAAKLFGQKGKGKASAYYGGAHPFGAASGSGCGSGHPFGAASGSGHGSGLKLAGEGLLRVGRVKARGSREEVWAGLARKTSGGLGKGDLMKNVRGKIVSRKKHALGRRAVAQGLLKPAKDMRKVRLG